MALSKNRPNQWHSLGMISLGVTAAVIALQSSGVLQFLEWAVLNQWFRLRSPEPIAVPIVLVTITEADIQTAGRWPLSDAQLATLLKRLKRARPLAIGLNLYRDLPIAPGQAELVEVFKTTPNLVGIQKAVVSSGVAAVPPPPVLRDRRQIGVNDLLLDADGIVRRNLLALGSVGQEQPALGTKLALIYLHQRGITPVRQPNSTCIHLGQARFCRLQPDAGGYVQVDTGGYQTLSNFLRPTTGIPTVSFTDVMTEQVPTAVLQDKLVLVGVKAESSWGDRFYTPYTTNSASTWAGVELHANVTAQIVSSALTGRPLLQGMPELGEWSWILLWAGIGAILGWSVRSLWWSIVLLPVLSSLILSLAYGLFLLGWWAVAASPILAFLGAGLVSRSFWVVQTLKQTNQLLERKVQERTQELIEKNLALEKARLAAEIANQALECLAHTDELTQVANRRFFNEYLQQVWQQLMQTQRPLGLILMDVDFFKLYNDTYGHLAGDECLAQLGAGLGATVKRSTDLVARYGGEEFAVILPDTPAPEAIQIAEAIQAMTKHLQIPHQSSEVKPYVTLSIGVTYTIPSASVSITQLFDQADRLLYQAKVEGRDRIIAAELNSFA